jgi:hypothetical protein
MRTPSVMTMCLPCRTKAGLLQGAYRIEVVDAGQLRHAQTATSTSRTSAPRSSSPATARYSRMASRIFSNASCSVAPWDQQPGSPGTETLTPSSERCNATLYFRDLRIWEYSQIFVRPPNALAHHLGAQSPPTRIL